MKDKVLESGSKERQESGSKKRLRSGSKDRQRSESNEEQSSGPTKDNDIRFNAKNTHYDFNNWSKCTRSRKKTSNIEIGSELVHRDSLQPPSPYNSVSAMARCHQNRLEH